MRLWWCWRCGRRAVVAWCRGDARGRGAAGSGDDGDGDGDGDGDDDRDGRFCW